MDLVESGALLSFYHCDNILVLALHDDDDLHVNTVLQLDNQTGPE